jgi:hypothetical protein
MVNAVTTRKGEVIQTPSFITKLFNHPLAGLGPGIRPVSG